MTRPLTYLTLLFLGCLSSPAARAGFTYADLVALIKGKNIRSVEELAAALPPELQSDITFRLKPHNRIQEGPRAIRFSPNGRLIIAHNDNPEKPGGRSVEVMEVSPSGNIQLHEILFPEKKGAPAISSDHGKREKRHLQSCIACHGDPPRMIWPAYNDWPDSCGAKDDSADQECLAFLKAAKTNPRFKDLKWDPANPAWPYYAGGTAAANQKSRLVRRMPNTRLTALVTFHNSRQMANVVQASPLYPQLRYNLIRQNRCTHHPYPEANQNRLKKLLMRDSAIVPPASWSGTRSQYVEDIFADREVPEYSSADVSSVSLSYQELNRLTYLEFFGVPKGNTGGTEVLTKAGRTGSGFTGQESGGDSTALLTVQLMNDLAKTDTKLRKFVKERAMSFSDVLAPSPYYDTKAFPDFDASAFNAALDPYFIREYDGRFSKVVDFDKDLCAYLSGKATEELAAYERLLNAWPKGTERPVANIPSAEELREIREIRSALKTDKLRAGRAILEHEKCIACHDPAAGNVVGPFFPFRDAKKFAVANLDTKTYGDTIVRRVQEVISRDTPLKHRMPLNRPAMSAEEQEALVLYLKSMAEPVGTASR